MRPWIDIRHYGRLGSDGGVDIFAIERVEENTNRAWYIQCRRYLAAHQSTLKQAVDDSLEKAEVIPEVLLVVVACDVTRAAHEAFDKYAKGKGIATPFLWTASVLEARLYAERKDLLFSYFDISAVREARQREASITRNLAIKRRLKTELLKIPKEVDWKKVTGHPYEKFAHSEAIIHSIDDNSYPDVDSQKPGIGGWFKLEVWDFYFNGIAFILRVEEGIQNCEGQWSIIDYGQEFDNKKYRKIKLYRLGRIPFRNIVEVDSTGDECYPQPHIYCRFADGGQPYEDFQYVYAEGYPYPLEPNLQFTLEPKGQKSPRNHK